jgi:5'-3' exonuclease
MSGNYIFIDGSYFIFFRYFSLVSYYTSRGLELPREPHLDEVFMEKYERLFLKTLTEFPKQLGLQKTYSFQMFVGKDDLRENLWRTKLYPQYKAGRKECKEIGPFFEIVYRDNWFENAAKVLQMDELEADDCIALSVKRLPNTSQIFIITSDKDYLQLAADHVHIYDLKYRKLTDAKSSHNNPDLDLFCKILTGDPSDNIPRSLKKCGPKTAVKFFEDRALFQKKLAEEEGANDRYKLNTSLVDFNFIPSELQEKFYESTNGLF